MEGDRRPGTILKIAAANFVSYNELKLCPSHTVNILLAPNGSGKSSVLSAIVLGLGGKPNIIGKSKQIADYIMYGKEEAKISLTLYDPLQKNEKLAVGRIIKRNGTSDWYLNKRHANLKEVEANMDRLHIQVNSLCQVLPQERVQDFSKMNSLHLLENVLKVIAGEMFENYSQLLEHRKAIQILKESIEKKTALKRDETLKYERLEKEVETIKEKQRVTKSVTSCRQKLSWILYKDKENEQNKVSEYLSEAKRKLENFEKQYEPAKNAIKKLEKKFSVMDEKIKNKRNKVNIDKDFVIKAVNAVKMSMDQIEHVIETLERKKHEASNIQTQIKENEHKIQELTQLLTDENGVELTEKVLSFDSIIREKMSLMKSLLDQENQIKQTEVALSNSLNILGNKLNEANSVTKKRLSLLAGHEQNVYKCYTWLSQHQDSFAGRVYGPLLMELNVNVSEGAKYVEFIIPKRDLISFVTETPKDMTSLLRTLRDRDKLMVNCAHCEPPEDDIRKLYPPLVPLNQIREIGFDCYLLDLIEAPATVLKHLCEMTKLHLIPVAFNPRKVNQAAVSKFTQITVYIVGDEFYRLSRSKYTNETSLNVVKVRPSRFLALSIDTELIRRTQLEINAKRETLGELEGEMTEVTESRAAVEKELNDLRNQKKSCSYRLEQFKSTTVRLRRHEEEHLRLVNSVKDWKAEEQVAAHNIQNILITNRPKLTEMLQRSKDFSVNSIDVKLCEQNCAIVKRARDAKRKELSQYEEGRTKLKSDRDKLETSLNEVKAETRDLLNRAKETTEGLEMGDPRFTKLYNNAFKALPDDLDQIRDKINSFKARERCLDNPLQAQHLSEYETAKELAESIGKELKKLSEDLNSVVSRFNSVFDVWLPEVRSLVRTLNDKFSDFFQKINCVGQVRLDTGGDELAVEQFGIEIRVKFRDDTELQVLDQYVQSGGERALTTAVFLLTLQRLSLLPFRCVDEINQGMDKFNERRVYNLLFNTITDSSSQYFLLTPKFLDGVTYPSTCTIFSIYNCPIYKMDQNHRHSFGQETDSDNKENVGRIKRMRIHSNE